MQLACPLCGRTLEYSGEPPRFCSFCGNALSTVAIAPVEPPDTQGRTVPPSREWASPEAATIAASAPRMTEAGGAVPEVVGGYRLLRRLGGGGMGAVYEGEQIATGRRVALKLILPEIAGTGEALERFRQEGRLASAVAHPRCVFVLAVEEDAGRPYIVMELMPGATLSDLVREQGPLSPDEAIAKVLDVIDGLQEAHRRGLVHRDVKPSNCFLEAGGRVKIGDFGLARSLVADSHLTHTGAFIGTPLYAAPEQIHKKDPTDAQSDVYSVAATLYFLLTGRAPFQSEGDAMATMARIVADDPPLLRSVRPGLPRALERVVRRGLERDRRRRYRDLEELRRALLPLLPAQPTVGGLGLRFAAECIDWLVRVTLAAIAGSIVLRPLAMVGVLPELDLMLSIAIYGQVFGLCICIGYYGICEGLWGCGLGKWLLRLRVGTATSVEPPGVRRAMLRAALFHVVFQVAGLVNLLPRLFVDLPPPGVLPNQEQALLTGLFGMASGGVFLIALVANFGTMRRGNNYRALHELLSGTCTYRLRPLGRQQRRALERRTFEPDVAHPEGLPQQVGPFHVRGALHGSERQQILLAQDPHLDRAVWLWLRPASEPPLPTAVRDISRTTRSRWVACGSDGERQWDAFIAPAGTPLPALAAQPPRLGWADVRPMLAELAEELDASCAEGTLPACLTPEQVWVQPDGQVQLVTIPFAEPTDTAGTDEARARHFLGEVAVTALEGAARPIDTAGDTVRGPLPPHASELLERLLGGPERAESLAQWRQELDTTRDRPGEVSRLRRAGHLAVTALMMHVPVFGPAPALLAGLVFIPLMVMQRWKNHDGDDEIPFVALYVGLACLYWVVWAFLFRGGYLFWRGGIYLRRADGRKAARWQCAVRALVIWGPIAALYCGAILLAYHEPEWPWLYFSLWVLGTALFPVHVALAILWPTRSLHDRIAGTYLVPE